MALLVLIAVFLLVVMSVLLSVYDCHFAMAVFTVSLSADACVVADLLQHWLVRAKCHCMMATLLLPVYVDIVIL